ncbi:MAG: BCCT family transporter [Victivallales bacterium]|nr:BCCT family transporter [Victivallales bacterium]MCF7888795.1 BCCT family transporter [Victivallales bacterium]
MSKPASMNKKKLKHMEPTGKHVFRASIILLFLMLFVSLFFKNAFLEGCNKILSVLICQLGWFYLLGVFFLVVAVLYIAFSRYGDIKLGGDDAKPEFSTFSWIAMMFAAGMGVGLVFWGCAQPLSLYYDPAPYLNVQPQTPDAFLYSIVICYFQWGIHPWCIYSILGILLAYTQFRKEERGLMSRTLLPIFGRGIIKSWVGKVIDIATVLATMTGLITTLGLTTLQVSRGFNFMFGLPLNNYTYFFIILIMTVCFLTSAISGVSKGVRIISNFNLVLCFLLLFCAFIFGPTTATFNTITSALGEYISQIVRMSLAINVNEIKMNSWTAKWTIFMWATWITWAPLVATFLARVSRGRTIREFISAVVFGPTLLTLIWFAAFGAMAYEVAPLIGKAAVSDPALTLFIVLKHYPFGFILSLMSVILLITFFITSADSAVLVLSILTSHGKLNPNNSRKFVWGILLSGLSFCVIRAGGLQLVKNIAIIGALPFLIFLLISVFSLIRFLSRDRRIIRDRWVKRILFEDKKIRDFDKL